MGRPEAKAIRLDGKASDPVSGMKKAINKMINNGSFSNIKLLFGHRRKIICQHIRAVFGLTKCF